jgi:D-aminopeptidase
MIEALRNRLRIVVFRLWPWGLVEDRGISFQAVTFVNYSARAGLSGAFSYEFSEVLTEEVFFFL